MTTVHTNDFVQHWEHIPGPAQAPSIISSSANYPFVPGLFQIAYTLVDSHDRHSVRSQSTFINPVRHWNTVVSLYGIDINCPAVAVCFWYFDTDTGVWRVFGGPVFCNDPGDVTRPYFPLAGWQFNRYQGHLVDMTIRGYWNYNKYRWPEWDSSFWKKDISAQAGVAPEVRIFYPPPNRELRLRYSWACNDGESPRSPVVIVPAISNPEAARNAIELATDTEAPQGACGIYLYCEDENGVEHRQSAPHVAVPNPANLNDFLFRVDGNVIYFHNYRETGVQPEVMPGRSFLGRLNLALRDSSDHICIDEDIVLSCPAIMPLNNAHGSCIARTVSGPIGGQVKLTTSFMPRSPTAFPVWVEGSQETNLVGVWINSPTACAGIAFRDWSGGGAFHFIPERLRIDLQAPNAAGIVATNESRSQNGHSSSEPFFRDTKINCRFPVVIEGQQSANWVFDNLTAVGNGFDSAIITHNNSGFFTIRGRLTCDGSRAIVAGITGSQIDIENIFTDQGFPEWFVCAYRSAPVIICSIKGMNVRLPFLHLITQTSPNKNMIRAKLTGVNSEPAPAEACIFTTRYNGIQLQADPSAVAQALQVRQPTLFEWQQTSYWQNWDNSLVPQLPGPIVTG